MFKIKMNNKKIQYGMYCEGKIFEITNHTNEVQNNFRKHVSSLTIICIQLLNEVFGELNLSINVSAHCCHVN